MVEVNSILPGKFLDLSYITAPNEKLAILEDFWRKLETVGELKLVAAPSLASSLLKVLKECLEEANLLVVLKCMEIFIKLFALLKGFFNDIFTKQVIIQASYKVLSAL